MFLVESTLCEWLASPGMLRSCPMAVELYKKVPKRYMLSFFLWRICEWLIIMSIAQVCCGAVPPFLYWWKTRESTAYLSRECGWLIGIPRCIAGLSGSWVVQESGKVLLIKFFMEYLWMIDYNIMPIAQVSVWCGAVQWQLSYTRKWQSAAFDVYSREYSVWMIGIPRYVAELSHGCGVVQERGRARQMGRAHDGGAHWLQEGILHLFSFIRTLWWMVKIFTIKNWHITAHFNNNY